MYCINCGTKLKEGQVFCKRCGAKVNDGGDGGEKSAAKPAPEKPEAGSASKPKAVEVGLGTNEKAATASPKASAAAKTAKRDARAAASKNAAQPAKAAAKSPKTPVAAKPAGGKTNPISDFKTPAQGGEGNRASAASAGQPSAASAKPEPIWPRAGIPGGTAGRTAAMPQVKMPVAASGADVQPRTADKPASAKRRRNAIIAIASGSVAAVALAATLFLVTGPIVPDAETPTVCTKATLVTPQDETGKVLNSYKVSLIDRKTGKEVSSRQVKKDDGFAIGDFQDADGQPITDGDYMLRYEDTESGNVYDGRYIDLRDGDSSAVSSTTGIKGDSEDRRYSDKKEIERLNQELQNWSMREQQWNEERGALSAENEGLRTELGAATQKNSEYEAVIEAGKLELDARQKTIDEKQKTIDDQATKLEDAKGQVDSLKKEVEEKQARIESLEKELKDSEGGSSDKELKEKQSEIDSLKAEIGKKQAEIDELNKRLAGSGTSHHDSADDDMTDDEPEDEELVEDESEGDEFEDDEYESEE